MEGEKSFGLIRVGYRNLTEACEESSKVVYERVYIGGVDVWRRRKKKSKQAWPSRVETLGLK